MGYGTVGRYSMLCFTVVSALEPSLEAFLVPKKKKTSGVCVCLCEYGMYIHMYITGV